MAAPPPQPTPATKTRLRLGYLVSRYPAISHTFILREVALLRELGFDIHVASINAPDRPLGRLTPQEQAEARDTFYVKQAGMGWALAAHVGTLLTAPLAYCRGLAGALRLAGLDLRQAVWALFYFTEALMLRRWARQRQLGHLHVHFATAASTVALILHRLEGLPFSMTVHGPDEFYDASAYHLGEKLAAAAFVCCIGSYARSQVMKLSAPEYWSRFEVAPLGVDPAVFAPRPPRAACATLQVLCVGRLVAAKGQHVLVEAVAQLRDTGRGVQLTLVGDGPDRASLAAAVRDRGLEGQVVFAGAVDQDHIRPLYEQADVFALASFAEGIPVVLMEAMAMEIPCVTTCITGIPELIRDGVDGLLVMPSDVEALAAALARLADDPETRRRLGEQGRRRVLERYELTRNVRYLAAVFARRLAPPQ
jgi:glycosyltransferase involved in cell wall biosynthesis